jgi:heme-degrading monooxygenase HmoA
MTNQGNESKYLLIWEFHVKAGKEQLFETIYCADGEWACFFRQDPAYGGTELVRNVKTPRSFMTMDFWESKTAYEAFCKQHQDEYQRIDARCEELTESESLIGAYERMR